MTVAIANLTRDEYELFRRLVYAQSGINLGSEKMNLVQSRLGKLIRHGGLDSFHEYYEQVRRDDSGRELGRLLDAISTNTTHLFREERHFELLRQTIRTWADNDRWRAENKALRIWSAGCSSGEEPHTIAMVAHDAMANHPQLDLKILATDLSSEMLARAKSGTYTAKDLRAIPESFRRRYFRTVRGGGEDNVQLVPDLMKRIKFASLNLMSATFPFRHGFHVIFCRNVMIYFDRDTRERLVNKFATHLKKSGYLMIGHSESLNGLDHPLDYEEPAVYRNGFDRSAKER